MKPGSGFVKTVAIVSIFVVLALSLARIGHLVEERQWRFREAEQSVEQALAGRQSLMGPALVSHCVEVWEQSSGDGKDRTTVAGKREFTLASTPSRLDVQGVSVMEPRYRGLFKVNTYASRLTLKARWESLASLQPKREHAGSQVDCAAPVLMVAVADARGIRQASLRARGVDLPVLAGTRHVAHPRGFHAVLPAPRSVDPDPLEAEVVIELAGTAAFGLAPIAGDTLVALKGDWPHPSFGGRFLPMTREVRDDGFDATWRISSLATTAAEEFSRGVGLCAPAAADVVLPDDALPRAAPAEAQPRGCIETLDVAFIDPVNPYSLSDRAIKYGLLFVGLTFLAVGGVEVLRGLRIHPIQYLLVGCAVSIFFLLLLSLSEHLRFEVAYAIAASACVALLAFYARHLLGGWRAGRWFGAGIATLYGALYVLLQLEQTALVVGSGLLFATLAGAMVLTRRLDWYRLFGNAVPTALETKDPTAR
jgi:inner membrane protein